MFSSLSRPLCLHLSQPGVNLRQRETRYKNGNLSNSPSKGVSGQHFSYKKQRKCAHICIWSKWVSSLKWHFTSRYLVPKSLPLLDALPAPTPCSLLSWWLIFIELQRLALASRTNSCSCNLSSSSQIIPERPSPWTPVSSFGRLSPSFPF